MSEQVLWSNKYYIQSAISIVAFLFVFGAISYYLQRKNPKWIGVWAGIKSWVFTAPIVFFFAGLPSPWPFVFIILIAISGAKTFFRMTGMYHRSWFVWLTYFFIFAQGYLIYEGHDRFFNIMPMIFLGFATLIPILRNSYTHMIQYIALALINFIFMGWGFMHLGRIVLWDGGPLMVLYLSLLFEVCEGANYAITRAFGRHKPFSNITNKFSIEGFIGSFILTGGLAYGLRAMLPDRSEIYWLTATVAVAVVGRMGGLLLSTIRRDLNIKDSGIFIIGRDDILSRVDKPIFAAPFFYFAYLIITGAIQI